MKKIAICISGQLRGLDQENQINELIKSLNADVFVSTWLQKGSTSAYDRFFPNTSLATLFIGKDKDLKYKYDVNKFINKYPNFYNLCYGNDIITNEYIKKILLNVRKINIESFPENFEKERNLKGVIYPESLLEKMPERYMYSLPMFYKIFDAYKLCLNYESENKINYDVVIRLRTDIEFSDLNYLINYIKTEKLSDNTIYTGGNITGTRREFFVNDTFGFGTKKSMDKYAILFEQLNDYWNLNKFPDFPLHLRAAENLLGYHIKNSNMINIPIGIYSQVKTNLFKKKYTEILNSLLDDLNMHKLDSNEKIVISILLAQSYIEKGINNYSEDEIKIIEKDLLTNPIYKNNLHLLDWILAIIYKKQKLYEKSISKYYDAVNFIGEFDSRPAIELGILLENEKRYVEAVKLLNETKIKFYKDTFVIRNLGNLYKKISQTFKTKEEKVFYLKLSELHLSRSIELSKGKNELANNSYKQVINELNLLKGEL